MAQRGAEMDNEDTQQVQSEPPAGGDQTQEPTSGGDSDPQVEAGGGGPESAGGGSPQRDRSVEVIPTKAMEQIKRREAERGRQQALQGLDVEAKKLGFRDHADLVKAASEARRTKQKPRRRDPEPVVGDEGEDPSELRSDDKRVGQLVGELKRSNRERAKLEREHERLELKVRKLEAMKLIERAAIRAGVKDIDYAIVVMTREISGMTKKQREAGFDEVEYFSKTLRKTHPYLYEAATVPVTTGPGGAAPPVPRDQQNQQTQQAGANGAGAKDAREMTREEFDKTLRAAGLQNPSGMP